MTTSPAGMRGRAARTALPDRTTTSIHQLRTHDGATIHGHLHTVPGATTVVCLAHPRQDLTHHPIVAELLDRGYAVWTQGTRSVNNDIDLVHERALLDLAAGQYFLRELEFDLVVTLGHSGGGPLFAYYHEQAGRDPGQRQALTPAGRPTFLSEAAMPVPDAAVFLAAHPGQGALLLNMIDPSVVDEADPMSIDPGLDLFNPANGFAPPPHVSRYPDVFIARYRAAQRERVDRIDAMAKAIAAETAQARAESSDRMRRLACAPRLLITYRTDADPRCIDLSLDPNDRSYGSLFGKRPDLTNYGLTGFGRIATADAWLSTWSGLSSNAGFVRCAPGLSKPTLFLELTGDQACTPSEAGAMFEAIGTSDKLRRRLPGTHFGAALSDGEPSGITLAATEIDHWLAERFCR
ncbi:alpha/beta hydrolase [Nocardia sp. NPDC059239]|uniref:alpha/beta hydrolase n=1 Tax=unclassified Nocardia TaxID=2637762 RepID=UPI0036CE9CB2